MHSVFYVSEWTSLFSFRESAMYGAVDAIESTCNWCFCNWTWILGGQKRLYQDYTDWVYSLYSMVMFQVGFVCTAKIGVVRSCYWRFSYLLRLLKTSAFREKRLLNWIVALDVSSTEMNALRSPQSDVLYTVIVIWLLRINKTINEEQMNCSSLQSSRPTRTR
jgi:hypothetical protein